MLNVSSTVVFFVLSHNGQIGRRKMHMVPVVQKKSLSPFETSVRLPYFQLAQQFSNVTETLSARGLLGSKKP